MIGYTLTGYFVIFIKFLIIILLAGLIGYEREKIHRPAGLRTHIIVGIGSLVLMLSSIQSFPGDLSRVVAGIVTGLGFLGAGTIFREHDVVKGLTTAASIWATAGVAMALALNNYFVAILGAVSIYLILEMKNYPIFSRLFPEDSYEENMQREDYLDNFWMARGNLNYQGDNGNPRSGKKVGENKNKNKRKRKN